MNDEWSSRDPGEHPQPTPDLASSVDVPLSDAEDDRPAGGGDRPATNWRRLIALSMIGGVVLGIGLAIAILAFDDGDDPTGSTPDEHETQQTRGYNT